jgi:hypothetical protein
MRRAGVLVAFALSAAAMAAGPTRAQGIDNTCVLALTKTDPATVNVAYPDEAAIYWIGGYQAAPGTRIRIEGRFPHARYTSFNVYDQAQRPIDALADVELGPEQGSANPFYVGAPRDAEPRKYTAYIEFGPRPERPQDRAPNTLYTGTGQNGAPNLNGTLIYRIYIPDAGLDETGGVGLPTVTLQAADGGPAPPSACATFAKPAVAGVNEQIAGSDASVPEQNRATNPPGWRKFVNLLDAAAARFGQNSETTQELGGRGGYLSNVHNAYLQVDTNRQFGEVLVTRLRAPTFPDTRGGSPTMGAGQLRYFSMCQNHLLSQRFIACRTDDQSVVGPDGFVTYVVSTPAQRPSTATAECGATWIPWGPSNAGLLIYRHMLPADDFAQAIQFAEPDHEVATMGDYFPVSRYYADAAAYDREVGC